jgi:ribokinase
MPKVVVIGSANVDFTVTVDRLPAPGETVLGGSFYHALGGKGANQAVAALKAGADVILLAKLGADAHGRQLGLHLAFLGLPKDHLLRDSGHPTGAALIMVDRSGQNLIAVAPGSNQHLTAEDVRRAAPILSQARVLLAQLEIPLPAVAEALRLAKKKGVLTILNPAPAQPLSSDILKLVDVLTPNEGEAQSLTGKAEAAVAARTLLTRGSAAVVVTLGAQGALLANETGTRLFPPFAVTAVDTTAAGDAFCGALACAVAEGRSLEDAIVFANAAGALATTKRGAQDSLPSRADIDQLCKTGR